MDFLQTIAGLPAILKIALPLLFIFLIGAVVKKLAKIVIIVLLVILAIVFLYPMFNY